MPFVEGGLVEEAVQPSGRGGFVEGGFTEPLNQNDSYDRVLRYEQALSDETPTKDEYLAYLQAKKEKPLLGERPMATLGEAALETGKMLATLPYKAGEAIGDVIMPQLTQEGLTPVDVAVATGAEVAARSELGARRLSGGLQETLLNEIDNLAQRFGQTIRSDDDKYQAFLGLADVKRKLAKAETGQQPAAQEFLQAYNIPKEAISPAGLEVGQFVAAPENIAFAGGGALVSQALRGAARGIPSLAQRVQRAGAGIGNVARIPEVQAGRAATAITGSPTVGQAVERAIGTGTTGIATGEALGLPVAGNIPIPGAGMAASAIGTAKAVGAGLETIGEAGAISGGQALSPIQRGLLGFGERIAAQENASRTARAFGNILARTGADVIVPKTASILVPALGAGAAGGLLAGLTGEEGDQIAAGIGSGFAFGGLEAGIRMAAAKGVFDANRVRATATEDLNTRPNDVQFTYIDPVTKAEQTVTLKDRDARAQLYEQLDDKQLVKALSEIANAENAGVEVVFHKDGDPVPQDLQQVRYKGVALSTDSVKSGKPTILVNVDKAVPETIPHEILHARIISDMVARIGSQIIEGNIDKAQFKSFANKYAKAMLQSGAPAKAKAIFNQVKDAFDPKLQRAQRIDALRYMADEFAAYYTQEFLAGKDPKTVLPGRLPSFFEVAFNNAKEAVSEKFTRRALQSGFDPIAKTFYGPDGKRIKIPWMEDAVKQLIIERKGFEPSEQKLDIRKLTPNQQAAVIMSRGFEDLYILNPDGSIGRPKSAQELIAQDADIAQRSIKLLDSLPAADRGTVTGLDSKGNTVIQGRLSLAEADALARSGIYSASTSRYITEIARAIQDGSLLSGSYWKVYGPRGRAGVFGEAQKLFLPYGISLNSAGGVLVKLVDFGRVQARLDAALQKQAYRNLFRSYDQALATLRDVYLKNLADPNAKPSAEALGGGVEGARKRNFFNEVMGAVPKKGDVLINEPTAGYTASRKGGSVYEDYRIERIQNIEQTGMKVPWSGDMGEQSSYRRTQLNFQPAEQLGDASVKTDANAGFRIMSKRGKFRVYSPDGDLLGIFDTEGQAKLKAEKSYAAQARLQPEIDQLQRPARDEVRQTPEAGGRNRPVHGSKSGQEGGQINRQVRQAGDVRFMPMSDLERSDLGLRISTRNPSAKKATENPITQQLSIDLDSITRTPGALPEIINTIGKYPGMRFERSGSMNRANEFIRFVANNLIYLYDSVLPEIRDRSKLWYDGARRLTEDWSKRFDTTREGVAGVIASLSPQKDWYQNVTLAERVFEVVKTKQNEVFSGPIEQWARTKMTSGQSPKRLVQDEVINGIAGKKFSDLSDYEKAVFVRAYDEVNNTRTYPIVSPEGKMLDIARKADGSPATYAWGDFNSIAKAVKIATDPSKKTISDSLGYEHKVRSFYDNILLPNNPEHGDVTIDTHAVAAALMLPLAGSDVYVAHNFGQGVPGSSVYGTSGTYGIYADAYRLAAKERGILPREMQSITWEAIRGLFTPEFKTASNKKLIENIWKEYKSGKATIDETRQRIVDTAGGIRNPSWFGSGSAAVAENATSINPSQLPGAGGVGRPGSNTGGGGNVPGTGAPEVGQRFMPALVPDATIPGAYSMSGYRVLPGKTGGRMRVYSPTGSLIGIAASTDEAQRLIQKKLR